MVRLWVATLRLSVIVGPGVDLSRAGPRVFAFFHGQQMELLRARRRGQVVLVSRSSDGELQTGVMRALGMSVVRGSSSRGGAAGIRGVLRALHGGREAALAVDGPRGPRGCAKAGAARSAHIAGAELLPLAAAASRAIVLDRAWDRFEVPLPFARVAVVVGAPVDAAAAARRSEVLSDAIASARRRALAALARSWPEEGA